MLRFTKMNGAGNDFIMLDNRDSSLALDRAQIARLCDRHRGIGADGLLLVEPARDGADFRMRYFNSDGGEAEMCGNGARCFARFARRISGIDGALRFETEAGVISATFEGERVKLAMSEPRALRLGAALEAGGQTITVHSVDTGVPHAVVFVDDLENAPVAALGAAIRHHAAFSPKGTNANFVQRKGGSEIAIRTFERGVEGETLACGTGVVASAIILHALDGAPTPISVRVRGGDVLSVGFKHDADGYRNVTLTGPADFVFDGEIAL